MRNLTRLLLPALLLALILMGCAGDGGADDTLGSSDPGSSSADPGETGSGEAGAADLGDFPIPGPGVGEVALTTDSDEIKVYTITFAGADFESVRDFYDDWTQSEADDYQRTEAESGGVTWLAVIDDRTRIIVVSPAVEGDDIAFVTLSDAVSG